MSESELYCITCLHHKLLLSFTLTLDISGIARTGSQKNHHNKACMTSSPWTHDITAVARPMTSSLLGPGTIILPVRILRYRSPYLISNFEMPSTNIVRLPNPDRRRLLVFLATRLKMPCTFRDPPRGTMSFLA